MGCNGNEKKTHCIRGHEYTPENTRWFNQSRACRTCNAERNKGLYSVQKVLRPPLDLKQISRLVDAAKDGVALNVLARRFGISPQQASEHVKRQERAE